LPLSSSLLIDALFAVLALFGPALRPNKESSVLTGFVSASWWAGASLWIT
jgi:hypothetical protein